MNRSAIRAQPRDKEITYCDDIKKNTHDRLIDRTFSFLNRDYTETLVRNAFIII